MELVSYVGKGDQIKYVGLKIGTFAFPHITTKMALRDLKQIFKGINVQGYTRKGGETRLTKSWKIES